MVVTTTVHLPLVASQFIKEEGGRSPKHFAAVQPSNALTIARATMGQPAKGKVYVKIWVLPQNHCLWQKGNKVLQEKVGTPLLAKCIESTRSLSSCPMLDSATIQCWSIKYTWLHFLTWHLKNLSVCWISVLALRVGFSHHSPTNWGNGASGALASCPRPSVANTGPANLFQLCF